MVERDQVDEETPNAARMYDYLLDGAHNFAADRAQAERVRAGYPGIAAAARANRAFLASVVRWCLAHGITQFLDLGCGVPTVGNVHEIAHRIDPGARVAYVDMEPVAVAHAREIIAALGTDTVTVTRADLREPETVLAAPGVAGLLDFTRPVAVLMIAVLHFVADRPRDAAELVATYRGALVPGSAVALSHSSTDQDDPEIAALIASTVAPYRDSATPGTLRTRARLRELLAGLELVEPGLVDVADWPTPATMPGPVGIYGILATLPSNQPPEPPEPLPGGDENSSAISASPSLPDTADHPNRGRSAYPRESGDHQVPATPPDDQPEQG